MCKILLVFLNGSNLSDHHYEELLIAWDKLDLQKGVRLDAAGKTIQGNAPEQLMIRLLSVTNHYWTINDGGLKTENSAPVVAGIPDIILFQDFADHYIPIESFFPPTPREIRLN